MSGDKTMTMHWGRQAARAAAFTTVMALGQAAHAQGQPIELRYDLYMAGLKVYEVGFAGEVSDKGYRTSVEMRPKGIGSIFTDDETDMRTSGTLAGGKPKPVSFQMRLNDRRYAVAWSGDAPTRTDRSEPLSDNKEKQVNAALTGPLADPLTAVMRLAVSDAAASCSMSQRVYNGKEVYEFALSPAGTANVEGKGAYVGPAKRCKLAYRTIAGFSNKTMRRNRESPPDITLLIAPVKAAGGKPLMVIVGASGTINGRSFTASLGKASLGGGPLVAAAKP
jgi:hypothetical protein